MFLPVEIHHVVGAPADGPHQLFHLFFNARRDGRVADVGVDLDQEVAANRHRLHLGVVDVGGDDGPAPGHFVAHEFGGDDARDARAHRVAHQALLAACVLHVLLHPLALAVFTDGHVFHLGRDDAFLGVVHLRDIGAALGAQGLTLQGGRFGTQLGEAGGVFALLAIVQRHGRAAFVVLHIATAGDPAAAHAGQALAHVDHGGRVGVGARGVVHAHHFAIGQRNIAHRHTQIKAAAGDVGLGGGGKRLARAGEQLDKGIGGIHCGSLLGESHKTGHAPQSIGAGSTHRPHGRQGAGFHPFPNGSSSYAGINQIKFAVSAAWAAISARLGSSAATPFFPRAPRSKRAV